MRGGGASGIMRGRVFFSEAMHGFGVAMDGLKMARRRVSLYGSVGAKVFNR